MRVIIIGAGVAGLSIGWKLLEGGADVTILERAQPVRGATWAAAGLIAPTVETAHASAEETQFARWSAELWPEFAGEIEQNSGRKIGYRRDGALIVASSEDEANRIVAQSNRKLLSANEARAREPMLGDVAGALWDGEEAQVDSRALGAALTHLFVRAGGQLSVNEAAVRIEVGDGWIGVTTPFNTYVADRILVAAGAWSGGIDMDDDVLPPVRPVKGEVLALVPPAGALLPKQVVWGNGVYLVPRGGRLLIGATMEEAGFDTSLTDTAEDWLTSRAIGLMPSLASWKIDEHWAGLRPASPDGLPVLGETKVQNLFVASGQFRNGILFAPAVAETVARLILGADVPEIRAFGPRRFGEAP